MATRNSDGIYAVHWPRGGKTVDIAPLAKRPDTLEGKTICHLWDYMFRGDEIFGWLEEALKERFPGVNFVSYEEFGSTHGEDEAHIIETLPTRLKELKVDAVISGMGC